MFLIHDVKPFFERVPRIFFHVFRLKRKYELPTERSKVFNYIIFSCPALILSKIQDGGHHGRHS